MLAYFFYIDGVGTIISISTAYGTILGLGKVGMILALLVTQIVAMPCSIWFAKLAEKFSARRALIGSIAVYALICCVGFYMGFSLEPHQEAYEAVKQADYTAPLTAAQPEDETQRKLYWDYADDCEQAIRIHEEYLIERYAETESLAALSAESRETVMQTAQSFFDKNHQAAWAYQNAIDFSTILFWAMAVLVGTVQGGIQAVSRSYFGKLIPKERSNEFFGFFDIFGKFASVMGPFLYSLIGGWTGRSSYGVLALLALFLVGLAIMIGGRRALEALDGE